MYLKSYLNFKQGVSHVTLNPKGFGSVRLHLIPPKPNTKNHLSLLYINGLDVLPLYPFESRLMKCFFHELIQNTKEGEIIPKETMELILKNTLNKTKLYYPSFKKEDLQDSLYEIIDTTENIALKKEIHEKYRIPLKLKDYKNSMTAPHRMDLMVSPMVLNEKWNCPLKCKNCYASSKDQLLMDIKDELTTFKWKKIIDKCREIGIPQLTFTGGEPLIRKDIAELIDHAKWHVTRLNTNGILMTKETSKKLSKSNLDSVQITLYSYDENIHDDMVAVKGAFTKTVEGIKNSLNAGLFVSINTPLSKENRHYKKTLEFIHELGITYVSASGLIPMGGAIDEINSGKSLSKLEIFEIMKEAVDYGKTAEMEMAFTSPGWLSSDELNELNLDIPSCGACLTNMGISPSGKVVPCQSWLNSEDVLGDFLEDPWKKVWERAKNKLNLNDEEELTCPLNKLKEGSFRC